MKKLRKRDELIFSSLEETLQSNRATFPWSSHYSYTISLDNIFAEITSCVVISRIKSCDGNESSPIELFLAAGTGGSRINENARVRTRCDCNRCSVSLSMNDTQGHAVGFATEVHVLEQESNAQQELNIRSLHRRRIRHTLHPHFHIHRREEVRLTTLKNVR